MIALKKPKLKHFSALMELNVTKEQKQFVETFEHLYEHRSKEDVIYAITKDGSMLGFFALDFGLSKKYTFASNNEIEIKNLFIDQNHQGQGVAKAALKRLELYVYSAYPDVRSVCMLVDKRNEGALRCCLSAGFEDTKKSFCDDNSNMIMVLRKSISAP